MISSFVRVNKRGRGVTHHSAGAETKDILLGWKRWSRRWMYATVGLFTDYTEFDIS